MHRRALLASIVPVGLSGCGDVRIINNTGQTETEEEPTTEPEEAPDEQEDEVEIPDIGVDPGEIRCPPFEPPVDTVVADTTTAPLRLGISEHELTLPETAFTLEITNESETTVSFGAYSWTLWKRVEAEWYHIVPFTQSTPEIILSTGNEHEWKFEIDNTDLSRLRWTDGENTTLNGIGPGEYALTLACNVEAGEQTERFGLCQSLTITGDSIEVTPTVDPETQQRAGSAVTVQTDTQAEPVRAYELVRADSNETPQRTLIAEQLFQSGTPQPHPLRNMIPFFADDVTRVQYAIATRQIHPLVDPPTVFEYEGQQYHLTTEEFIEPEETETEAETETDIETGTEEE